MIRDVVVFPDAVAAVTSYLSGALGVPTSKRIPNPRPAEFYRVFRAGGTSRDVVIDDATIVVEAWAPSDEEADDLAQLARGHLLAIAGHTLDDGTLVYGATEVAAPADLPDPVSAQSRSTATYQVRVRGVSIDTAS